MINVRRKSCLICILFYFTVSSEKIRPESCHKSLDAIQPYTAFTSLRSHGESVSSESVSRVTTASLTASRSSCVASYTKSSCVSWCCGESRHHGSGRIAYIRGNSYRHGRSRARLGCTLAAFAGSENQDAVRQFMDFFAAPERQFQRAGDWAWFPPGQAATAMDGFMEEDVLALTPESIILDCSTWLDPASSWAPTLRNLPSRRSGDVRTLLERTTMLLSVSVSISALTRYSTGHFARGQKPGRSSQRRL